jgi:hypothetical protein
MNIYHLTLTEDEAFSLLAAISTERTRVEAHLSGRTDPAHLIRLLSLSERIGTALEAVPIPGPVFDGEDL